LSVDTNKQRLGRMLELVGVGLGPYVEQALEAHYGKNWRLHAQFPDTVARGGRLDVQALLRLFQNEWRDVFSTMLGHEVRDAATATNAGRNAWAHVAPGADCPRDITRRALLGGAELLEAIKAPNAREARQIAENALVALHEPGTAAVAKAPAKAEAQPPSRPTLTLKSETPKPAAGGTLTLDLDGGQGVQGLEPWFRIAPPRDDITAGRLTLDHFAANLAVVDRKEVDGAYGDADEFFRSTHITGGLRLVLENGAKRLAGVGGPSVIGLQTSFGGGKTHTMLALLHLCRASDPKALPGVGPLLEEAGVSGFQGATAVAFSGTDKGPDVPLIYADSRPVRTIWGYLAFRIAGQTGLELIGASEEAGTNPGGEALEKVLLASGGPVLILLDEIVAYVKQLAGERYQAALSFFQSLTEAASRVPNALVVGSLPESVSEVGGDEGMATLQQLEKLFGRQQSTWQAAQGSETYAIVRRRLFQELDAKGERARDKAVDEFRKLYRNNKQDFPPGKDEQAYAELMREAYPVHPMLFDKLAQEWGGLDKFQRTRGVLKFMAETARKLWLDGRPEPLILPGSIPLRDPQVRGTLSDALSGPAWGAIIDGEVESDRALSVHLDSERQRYGEARAATRAARAVFICTAPRGEAKGGLTRAELRLACAMPGENVSIFGDALNELAGRAGHLYTSADAYWFGSQPTLRKLAEARAQDRSDDDADVEIIKVLEGEAKGQAKGGFVRVYACPIEPFEVEEASGVGLVLLHPNAPDTRTDGSPAVEKATDGLKRRSGGRLRQARNTLIFCAADLNALREARKAAKLVLGWRSIVEDKGLDLKESQRQDAQRELETSRAAVEASVRRAWSSVLVPAQARTEGEAFDFDPITIRNTSGKSVAQAVWDRIKADVLVFERLGRLTLSDRLAEAWPPGEDHLALAQIRDWFIQYVRFERLRDESVLADAIVDLVSDTQTAFAYADGLGEEGTYRGLAFGKLITPRFDGEAVLVRRQAAEAQLASLQRPISPVIEPGSPSPPVLSPTGGPNAPEPPPARVLRRFYGSVDLNPDRPIRDLQPIVDSVISELMRTDGARVTIRVEIEATASKGFDPGDAAIVRDNARTLKFRPEATEFSED
jgi:hypothetical protein